MNRQEEQELLARLLTENMQLNWDLCKAQKRVTVLEKALCISNFPDPQPKSCPDRIPNLCAGDIYRSTKSQAFRIYIVCEDSAGGLLVRNEPDGAYFQPHRLAWENMEFIGIAVKPSRVC